MEVDTKQKLMKAARELFAHHGFDGTSVKDICEAAGVNVSLVSYHFAGKDGLYRAVLEEFGSSRVPSLIAVLQTPKSLEEMRLRLEMFLNEVALVHTEQPELSRIVHRECSRSSDVAQSIFHKIFHQTFTELLRFITESVNGGLLRHDLDPMLTATNLIGVMVHMSMTDSIREHFFQKSLHDPVFRKHAVEHCVRLFIDGARRVEE